MIYNIILSLFLSISLAIGMQENRSIAPNPQLLEKLKKILDEEKANKGTFIKKIMDDLKDCTDGKMVELNYLTLKSSYWWDQIPATMIDFVPKFTPEKFNDRKILSIDRKFQSSVYDREQPFVICSYEETVPLGENNCKKRFFVNSWNSARDKIKFFTREDIFKTIKIKNRKIPDYLTGIVDYGYLINTKYDTYPSVFQMMKTFKTVKYREKEACSKASRTLINQPPFEVVLTAVNNILESESYRKFAQQNHPLNKIIQDHLKKLKYKSEKNQFKQDTTENLPKEYNRSVMYSKILKNMGDIVELMSVFDVDMDQEQCDIPNFINGDDVKPKDPYYLYVQLYEIFNDLLFLIMYLDDPYTTSDFNNFLTQTLVDRFPLIADLQKNKAIFMASYPMRSGMDAFVNASMAIGHAPEAFSIAPKVMGLENSVYFEIAHLVRYYQDRGEQRLFASLAKTPTEDEKNRIDNSLIEAFAEDQIRSSLLYDPHYIPHAEMNNAKTIRTYEQELIRYFQHQQYYPGLASYNAEKQDESNKLDFEADYNADKQDESNKLDFENVKKRIESFFISAIMDSPNVKKLFPLFKIKGQSYLEIPIFMTNNLEVTEYMTDNFMAEKMLSTLTGSINGLIDNHFIVGKYPAITTGITTDTVNFSEDTKFMDKIYAKINHIINIKQEWNVSDESVISCEKIINEIMNEYSNSRPDILEVIQNFVVDKYLNQLKELKKNSPFLSQNSLQQLMNEVTLDLQNILRDLGENLTYNPLETYRAQQQYTPNPFVILWDITLEIDRGPCYSLMDKFRSEIESGKIVFVLFKSLQKYGNLGIGKSKAGAVTLIGKKIPFVDEIHKKLTKYGEDVFSQHQEYALMTFFHDRFDVVTKQPLFQDNEKFYFQATERQASKILAQSQELGEENKLTQSNGCLFSKIPKSAENCDPRISYSDTFGFALPTVTPIEARLCRYSVGLNPKGLQ